MTTKLMLPKLPIGQQSFRMLRENGYLYIDKTDLVLQMIEDGGHYFLTRPRRMGKSLLVSLLQELFEGRRELFEGLAITSHCRASSRVSTHTAAGTRFAPSARCCTYFHSMR